jgi:hypothetical protein
LTSRVRTVPALRVTSAMGVLFTTGIQIVMVVLFPNGGSTQYCYSTVLRGHHSKAKEQWKAFFAELLRSIAQYTMYTDIE